MARCEDTPFPHHRLGVIIINHKLCPPRRLPSDVKIGFGLGNLSNDILVFLFPCLIDILD